MPEICKTDLLFIIDQLELRRDDLAQRGSGSTRIINKIRIINVFINKLKKKLL